MSEREQWIGVGAGGVSYFGSEEDATEWAEEEAKSYSQTMPASAGVLIHQIVRTKELRPDSRPHWRGGFEAAISDPNNSSIYRRSQEMGGKQAEGLDRVERAIRAAAEAIYFADPSDYASGLWHVLRSLWPEAYEAGDADALGDLLFGRGDDPEDTGLPRAAAWRLLRFAFESPPEATGIARRIREFLREWYASQEGYQKGDLTLWDDPPLAKIVDLVTPPPPEPEP